MSNSLRTQDVTVEAAPKMRRNEVLHLLRIGQSRIERMLAAENDGSLDMKGLFQARRIEQLVGAAWGQVVPGRSAFCWPAFLVPGEPEDTAVRLQSAVDEYLNAEHVAIVQAALPVRAVTDAVRLVRAGYHHLADLDYLACTFDRYPREQPHGDLEFQCCAPADEMRLGKLIERTYAGSLDCTELEGIRAIQDVLTGYRETGKHRPDWWLFARYGGEDVGCILLADHPEHDQSELMYLGIVPEARGHGWGVQVTRYAQWMMGHVPRGRMVLAVDDNNWPAQAVYSVTGFDHWDRRCVYVREARVGG
jgi:mycothiol synthase